VVMRACLPMMPGELSDTFFWAASYCVCVAVPRREVLDICWTDVSRELFLGESPGLEGAIMCQGCTVEVLCSQIAYGERASLPG
jgi:hypothetical protein